MTKFDSFIYLKNHPLAGMKSPIKKKSTKSHSTLLDIPSYGTITSPAKPTIATKVYSSKYYLLSMTK
jgi:hypothetical protein